MGGKKRTHQGKIRDLQSAEIFEITHKMGFASLEGNKAQEK
jgi:hypothetical protein